MKLSPASAGATGSAERALSSHSPQWRHFFAVSEISLSQKGQGFIEVWRILSRKGTTQVSGRLA